MLLNPKRMQDKVLEQRFRAGDFRSLVLEAMVGQGCGREKAEHIIGQVERGDAVIANRVASAMLGDLLVTVP